MSLVASESEGAGDEVPDRRLDWWSWPDGERGDLRDDEGEGGEDRHEYGDLLLGNELAAMAIGSDVKALSLRSVFELLLRSDLRT